jgi:general secretion pathway protein G
VPEATLKSPLAPDDEEEAYIYVGAGLKTDSGAQLPIAYENPDLHGGYMTNVLFIDGHVEYTTRDRLDQLLEEVNEAKGESEDGEKEESPEAEPEEKADDSDAEMKKQQEEEEREERGESRQRGNARSARRRSGGGSNEVSLAHAVVSNSGPIATAIDTFRLDVGRYPEELSELVEKPADEAEAKKWNGPYVKSVENLVDTWGNAINYESPGKVNENSYDLWSVGPDGEDGTDDDIANH